jgi:nitrogen fixation protein FixH
MNMHAAIEDSGGERRRPKEVTGRTVLVCVVAFFAVVSVVNAIMICAAVSTFGGLETESSYKAGLGFAREMDAAAAQNQRHWAVAAKVGPLTDGRIELDLTARNRAGQPLVGFDVVARLSHPADRRRDHTVDLRPAGAGRYVGSVEATAGQWDLVIDILNGERVFRSRERVVLKDSGER